MDFYYYNIMPNMLVYSNYITHHYLTAQLHKLSILSYATCYPYSSHVSFIVGCRNTGLNRRSPLVIYDAPRYEDNGHVYVYVCIFVCSVDKLKVYAHMNVWLEHRLSVTCT